MPNQKTMPNGRSASVVVRKNGRKKLQRKKPNEQRRNASESTRKSQRSLQSEVAATPVNAQVLDVVMIERDLLRNGEMIESARLADDEMKEIDQALDVDLHRQLARLGLFDLCMPTSDMAKIAPHQEHDPAHPIASRHVLSDLTNGEVAADDRDPEARRDHPRKRKTTVNSVPVPSHRHLISTR